ncbi:hypothetical protein ACMFMG_002627 [Clarireedia jacksonii]
MNTLGHENSIQPWLDCSHPEDNEGDLEDLRLPPVSFSQTETVEGLEAFFTLRLDRVAKSQDVNRN